MQKNGSEMERQSSHKRGVEQLLQTKPTFEEESKSDSSDPKIHQTKTGDKKTHWRGIEHLLKTKKEMASRSDKNEEKESGKHPDLEEVPKVPVQQRSKTEENLIEDKETPKPETATVAKHGAIQGFLSRFGKKAVKQDAVEAIEQNLGKHEQKDTSVQSIEAKEQRPEENDVEQDMGPATRTGNSTSSTFFLNRFAKKNGHPPKTQENAQRTDEQMNIESNEENISLPKLNTTYKEDEVQDQQSDSPLKAKKSPRTKPTLKKMNVPLMEKSPRKRRKQGQLDIFVDQRDLLKIVVDRGSTERVQDHTASEEVSGNAVTSTSGRDNINAIMHYRKPLLEQEDVHEKRDIYVESKATGEFHKINRQKLEKLGIEKKEENVEVEGLSQHQTKHVIDPNTVQRFRNVLHHLSLLVAGFLAGVAAVVLLLQEGRSSNAHFLLIFSSYAGAFHSLLSVPISATIAYSLHFLSDARSERRSRSSSRMMILGHIRRRPRWRKSGIARLVATIAYLVAFASNAVATSTDHKIFLKYIEDPTWFESSEELNAIDLWRWFVLNSVRCWSVIIGWAGTVYCNSSLKAELLSPQAVRESRLHQINDPPGKRSSSSASQLPA